MKLKDKEREKYITDNMGLVYSCANRFRGRGVEYEDLVQYGCLGLIKAADGFDEKLGFRFSTYAVPSILGEIKRVFRDYGSVKVGRSDREKLNKILKIKDELTLKSDREPTVFEIASASDIPADDVSALLCAAMPVVSLTADEDNDERQTDVVCEDMTVNLSEIISLKTAVNDLSETDKKIVELRYYSGLTQSSVAEKTGMTQVQVSRREKVILSFLREKLR